MSSDEPSDLPLASPEPAPAPPSPVPAAPKRWERWARRLAPWASLVLSSVGAAYMDRGEEQGAWIVGWAALGFVALVVLGLAYRPPTAELSQRRARLHALTRFAVFSGSQSLVQTCLFFSGPFYYEALAFTPAQLLFALAFALAAIVSSWDPWCERALLHPIAGPLLSAFSSFVAWNAALPMLGMPHRRAVWLAAGLVSVLVPVVHLMSRPPRGERPALRRTEVLIAGSLVPLCLAVFGVRALPAAPLKVVDSGLGTAVAERELVGRARHFPTPPGKLWCYSAIFAPRGLSDDLLHVWSRDGEPLARIPLRVRGGRKQGFRTWSYLPLPPHAQGRYRCEVLTQFGQTLGVSAANVGPTRR
ncbi:MAG TPA: DUF2914 domain-containing protein [Polyangiales bacterium]